MIDGLSEKENELVLRSLREYSESCEAPELIPECPFSIEIGQNERGCGEECMDLLGKHEAPRPQRRTEIGTGLVISRPMRPRPRRSGEFEGRPFDAKEVYLQDSENSAPHRWRLPALLYAIKETTQTPPGDNAPVVERQDHIGDLLDSLAQCGINTQSLVDPWIRQHASRAIFGRAYAQWLSNRTSQTNPVVESWVQLLDEVVPREIAPRRLLSNSGRGARDRVGGVGESGVCRALRSRIGNCWTRWGCAGLWCARGRCIGSWPSTA